MTDDFSDLPLSATSPIPIPSPTSSSSPSLIYPYYSTTPSSMPSLILQIWWQQWWSYWALFTQLHPTTGIIFSIPGGHSSPSSLFSWWIMILKWKWMSPYHCSFLPPLSPSSTFFSIHEAKSPSSLHFPSWISIPSALLSWLPLCYSWPYLATTSLIKFPAPFL